MSYAERLARAVRRAGPEDEDALQAFRRAMFGPEGRQTRPEYARWLFGENPHVAPGAPPMWLMERGGGVVGQQAAIPVPLEIRNRAFSAQWAVDLMVHPEWRMRGVGPALSQAQVDSCDVALALSVSEAAYKAFLTSGWTDMGQLPFYVRPLQAERLVAAHGAPWWLRELAHWTPDRAVGGSAWVAARLLERVSGTHLVPIPAFDSRADALWVDAKADYGVVARRDHATLRWRFDQCPHRDRYHRFYLVRPGEVLGYAVTRVEAWHGVPVGRIVDHFGPARWVAPLLGEVVEQMHADGLAAVFYEGLDQRAARALFGLGFVAGPRITRFMFKAQPTLPVHRAWLADPNQWFVTDADADREL
jgi:GNAT superfamily N-acetyltransferase